MVINPIVGVYIPIIRIPIKGWMTILNTRSLDPGSILLLEKVSETMDLVKGKEESSRRTFTLAVNH